jgi:hypothetical protein
LDVASELDPAMLATLARLVVCAECTGQKQRRLVIAPDRESRNPYRDD